MDLSLSEGLAQLRRADIEHVLLPILAQLILIIIVARLFARGFRAIGQPAVVGEIAAGVVLGPSLLGALFPDVFAAIFQPEVHGVPLELTRTLFGFSLTILSQIGLVLLLFLIGLEFDFSHLRFNSTSALSISVAGVAFPLALGIGVAYLIHPVLGGDIPILSFSLFLGVALSITAIPILGRMMMELGITQTRIGAVTISSAAVDDAIGWILLAAVAAIARSGFEPGSAVLMIAETVLFAAFMICIARPILSRAIRWYMKKYGKELGVDALAVLLGLLFACAIVTNLIGIFAIFGAFILGAVLSGEKEFREAIKDRLYSFVTAFFLPIFFCYTGLRTDIGSLNSLGLWGMCGLIFAAAVIGKFGGCFGAARLGGFSNREAGCIGVMMNTRALMELIVINVGRDLGVIPPVVFTMLVLMALGTTIMTTPILMWFQRGTELEPCIRHTWYKEPLPVTPESNGDGEGHVRILARRSHENALP